MKLTLVTPEKRVAMSLPIKEVTLPGYMGELNILPGHAPLMTTLGSGVLKYITEKDEEFSLAVSWGYCEINPDSINVLSEVLTTKKEIDLQAVKKETTDLEKQISTEFLEETTFEKLQMKLEELRTKANFAEK